VHEKIANAIRTSCNEYNGGDFKTTLGSLYFLVHNTTKEDVNREVAKWVHLNGVDSHATIILPERFFKQ
jgi:hypothetical protein